MGFPKTHWSKPPAIQVMALAFVALLVSHGPTYAYSRLRMELSVVAPEVAKLLKMRKEDSVALGDFNGPAHLPSHAAPAIVQNLTEELAALKIKVDAEAELSITGDYTDVIDKRTKRLAVLLRFKVQDRTGKTVMELSRGLFGETTIVSLLGLSGEFPTSRDMLAGEDKLKNSIDKPKPALADRRIKAGESSPFALEILTKNAIGALEAVKPTVQDSLAFVSLKKKEPFAVRLVNDSPNDVAALLSIDGLNLFHFTSDRASPEDEPPVLMVVVPAKNNLVLNGWRRTAKTSDDFLPGEYPAQAAPALPKAAKLGVVTACFGPAWYAADHPGKWLESVGLDNEKTNTPIMAEVQSKQKKFYVGSLQAAVSVRYTTDATEPKAKPNK